KKINLRAYLKKINLRAYRSLLAGMITIGTVAGLTTKIQAKHATSKATIKKIINNKHESTMKVVNTNGYIYKNYDLKTKINRLNKFKNKILKTRYVYNVKLANGQNVLLNRVKIGALSGFVAAVNLKPISNKLQNSHGHATENNSNEMRLTNPPSGNVQSATNASNVFTTREIEQINKYKAQAQAIGNGFSSQDMFISQPVIGGEFNPGELNSTYIQNSIDWINFFRQMVGQPSIFDNMSWDRDAQYGAATLAAANNSSGTNKLSHGLVDFNKPAFISDADWQRGAAATNDGNISSGIDSPYDVVTNFLNDGFNIDPAAGPGHREWLLGNIDQVGIGHAGQYNSYKLFEPGMNNSYTASQPINFPGKGVFPIDLVQNTVWSISVPGRYGGNTPTVRIHDNTSNTDVAVSDDSSGGTTVSAKNITTYGYGFLDTTAWFTPDHNAIKVNHSYTITVSGLPGIRSPYSYTTKLFDLGITNNH
ncbi:CAP domain-containing protein, partial [Lactobacillaceae bacterium Scapto_B20]